MEKNAKIYVAGHRGMVGSAIVRELKRQGYTNIITRTHKELDLCRAAWYIKGHIWFRTKDVLQDDFRSYILSELYEQ